MGAATAYVVVIITTIAVGFAVAMLSQRQDRSRDRAFLAGAVLSLAVMGIVVLLQKWKGGKWR